MNKKVRREEIKMSTKAGSHVQQTNNQELRVGEEGHRLLVPEVKKKKPKKLKTFSV